MNIKEILAAKKALRFPPPAPSQIKELQKPNELSVSTDEQVAAIFFLYARKSKEIFLHELFDAFNIPYTPWTLKASSEQPPKELVLAMIEYYMRTTPISLNSIMETEKVLRGIGRVLSDKQIQILITYLERSR